MLMSAWSWLMQVRCTQKHPCTRALTRCARAPASAMCWSTAAATQKVELPRSSASPCMEWKSWMVSYTLRLLLLVSARGCMASTLWHEQYMSVRWSGQAIKKQVDCRTYGREA